MNISNDFRKAIAESFYDKEIEVWGTTPDIDDEGAIIDNEKTKLVETIMGNFQFKTQEYIQQNYGREYIAEAIVTCSNTLATLAKIGDIAVYNNVDYEIKAIIPSDSHITLLLHGSGLNE